MNSTTDIVVAIATIGSPVGCQRTVKAVLEQQVPEDMRFSVVIIDNNPTPADLAVPSGVFRWHEPRAGISSARNAAVRLALTESADVLAFIDDDEIPADPTWLAHLVGGLDSLDADITTGPVLSVLEPSAPEWFRRHPVFNRRRYATGKRLAEAATNNVAFRMSALRRLERWFDPRLGLVGGSDTDLTRRLSTDGHVIRWVDEAVVLEAVSRSRATVGWVLRRSMRLGANRVQRWRIRTPGEPPILATVAGSIGELILGGIGALLLVLASRRLAFVALGRAARGFGAVAAVLGRNYREYAHRSAA